jgi:hypothetical protein
MLRKLQRFKVKTVLVASVDVFHGEIIVGTGLSFWDGENLLTDIIGLDGSILPTDWYTIHTIGEPQLAIYSETLH